MKVSLMILVPVAASSRLLKGKPLSSRNRIWLSCVVNPVGCVGRTICPVSCAVCEDDIGVYSASILGSPARVHFLSSVSANAVMMKRKMTGERLSPCLTPTVCRMSADSLPTFSVTRRSE